MIGRATEVVEARTSDRFLEAFNAIDRLLRRRFRIDRGKGFFAVVEIAAARDRAVKRYELDLKEYADLRNAITHERTDGRAIAEPHPDTVASLESILERLTRPPKVGELFRHRVERADVGEPIGRAAKAMLDGNFSQVPVYDASRFVELLTAETLARWLAHELASGVGLVEEASIRDVLRFTEDPEHFAFLGKGDTAYDALAMFDDFTRRGKSLDAILVTESGKRDERPLGIITVFDIPKLIGAVSIPGPQP
ncbi:MAG TPA: CBS domain-containing protein [Gaiellaceae bacterium]|nr:CBS domain-containing protein [Gaiellaceae bacterium]